jgi:hypothetical protein
MGYGASSSGGSRGDGGSGGAFTGGGLMTGKTWHGTKAHFGAGGLQGYSTNGGAYKSPTGQNVNSSFQSPGAGPSMPYPGGYVPPVLTQPIPPPPPNYVPPTVPPVVPPGPLKPPKFAPYSGFIDPMIQAVSYSPGNWRGNIGAFGTSLYSNPTTGTPGFGTGLGNYVGSGSSGAGGKGDFGGKW